MNTDPVELNFTCLANNISDIMLELGHPDPESWKAMVPPAALHHPDLTVQRFEISRVWRQILLSLPMEYADATREARSCLVETLCEPIDYLRFFRLYVIPCAIKHQLPLQTHMTN